MPINNTQSSSLANLFNHFSRWAPARSAPNQAMRILLFVVLLINTVFGLTQIAPVPVMAATLSSANTLNLTGAGYLSVGHDAALNLSAHLTIEAWVRLAADMPDCGTVVGKDYASGYWLGFCNRRARLYSQGSAAGKSALNATQQIGLNEWTHVAATFDGQQEAIYLNGMLAITHTATGQPGNNKLGLQIGADQGQYLFQGDIADVRLWEVARNQSEIQHDMVSLLSDSRSGLVANWHLLGNGSESRNRYPATVINTATFDGPAAPPAEIDPTVIPRLESTPAIDGSCQEPAYLDGIRVPVWYQPNYSPAFAMSWAYIGATATQLYVCFSDVDLRIQFGAVYIDSDNGASKVATSDDFVVRVDKNNLASSNTGNGAGDYTNKGIPGYSAARSLGELTQSMEFALPRSEVNTGDGLFRMGLIHHWLDNVSGVDFGWPNTIGYNSPATWSVLRINDSATPRADSTAPTIRVRHEPSPEIRARQMVTITVNATDDVDLAQIDLYMATGTPVQTCMLNGLNDVAASCVYSAALPLGRHTYYAVALDHRGRRALSAMGSLFVQVDGRAPWVHVHSEPRIATSNHTVTITASAHDPSGLPLLRIDLEGDMTPAAQYCDQDGAPTNRTCTMVVTAPRNRRVIWYSATARDSEGLETRSPSYPAVVDNVGPDYDGDTLSDAVEEALGTNMFTSDSDRDALPDNWEALGLQFGDGNWVDLRGMGASPNTKDIFLQIDYERGARLEPSVIPYLVNLYRVHGIVLHVTENERPRPTAPSGAVSMRSAEQAASLRDPQEQYYFSPRSNWTHHYMYVRHNPGVSGAWHYVTIDVNTNNCPLTTPDPQNDPICIGGRRDVEDQKYRVLHELGHNLGMGHGGTNMSTPFPDNGDVLTYYSDWDIDNYKPNYISAMNYLYGTSGRVCYNPTMGGFVQAIDYADRELSQLIENQLNESATFGSSFLAGMSCAGMAAGFSRPAFFYTCTDNNAVRWNNLHDGQQLLSRQRQTGGWSQFGLPILPNGIDWNCNGVIDSALTQENINGDSRNNSFGNGASNQTLTSMNDWQNIPFQPSSVCWILRDTAARGTVFPVDYLNRIGRSDCQVASATNAATALTEQSGASEMQMAYSYAAQQPSHVHRHTSFGPTPDGQPHGDNDESEFVPLPNVETCDDVDNDGDGQIDEGCADSDSDGIIDALDNCSSTPNADQADSDGDRLGDVCELLAVDNLSASVSGMTVTLSWTAPLSDSHGFAVYRRCSDEDTLRRIGDSYPSTQTNSFVYTVTQTACIYTVRSINLQGEETGEANLRTGLVTIPGNSVFMPLAVR